MSVRGEEMRERELLTIIKKGESETLEFKESFDRETIETAAAFANTNDGIILIGVSDKGEIKGIQTGKESINVWANEIAQATEPSVIPEIETCEIKGKELVAVRIKESPLKPIASKGACYVRIKNSNRKLTPKEIAELHLRTIGSSWDSCPADAGLDDIDIEKVKDYIELANETGRRKINENPAEVLRKLDLIKDDKATWAAVLLFGKEPQRFVSQAKIHCGRFKDETTIIDDELIEGTVIEQVDKTLGFVKRHLKLKFEITGEARRKEEWEYPLPAVREAIINAICHRDYTEPSDIQIRIYDDELIVWNPGNLPLGITLEKLYRTHKSVLRNKLIAQVFFDIAFIEMWGTGIHRMIQDCLEQGIPEPKFEEYQGFRVIFRRFCIPEEIERKLNDRQKRLIELIKKKGEIAFKDYKGIFLNIAERTLRKDLEDLVKLKVLSATGEKKGRKYQLTAISAKYRQNIGNTPKEVGK